MERRTPQKRSPGCAGRPPHRWLWAAYLCLPLLGCSSLVSEDPTGRYRLKLAALWIGEGSDEDSWTQAHQQGLCKALRDLPRVVNVLAPELPAGTESPDPCRAPLALSNIDTPDKLREAVGLAVNRGAQIIIANSLTHRRWIEEIAFEYSGVGFLVAAALMPKADLDRHGNIAPFYGLPEQAWFVAGYAAARASTTHRLGMIAGVPSPEAARNVTAFARGAQLADREGVTGLATTVVELRWLGAWKDDGKRDRFSYRMSCCGGDQMLYGEEVLAAQLVDSDCDVIAHMTDTPRVQQRIAAWQAKGPPKFDGAPRPIYAIGYAHSEACLDPAAPAGSGKTLVGCMGVVQWDWSLLYREMLGWINTEGWEFRNWVQRMSPAPQPSIVKYQPVAVSELEKRDLNPSEDSMSLLNRLRTAYAGEEGARKVFAGPYTVNYLQRGNFPNDNPGFTCPALDWFRTCWLADGVYERKTISAKNHLELGEVLRSRVPTKEDSEAETQQRVLLRTPAGDYKHNCWDYY